MLGGAGARLRECATIIDVQAIKSAPRRDSAAWRRASRPRRVRREPHQGQSLRVRYDASEPRQPNLYGYVLGDPVNGFDPSGLWVTGEDLWALEAMWEEAGQSPVDAAARSIDATPIFDPNSFEERAACSREAGRHFGKDCPAIKAFLDASGPTLLGTDPNSEFCQCVGWYYVQNCLFCGADSE